MTHADRPHRICRARCSLLVKLSLHGGNSVQKNRCPFFFFEGLPVSGSTVSPSEPPSPSPSDSPISTSCDSSDWFDICESLLFAVSSSYSSTGREGEVKAFWKGEVGSGRCPFTPAKLAVVGVVEVGPPGSSSGVCVGWCDMGGTGARGVVGVVASPGYSPRPKPMVTDCTEVMTATVGKQARSILNES